MVALWVFAIATCIGVGVLALIAGAQARRIQRLETRVTVLARQFDHMPTQAEPDIAADTNHPLVTPETKTEPEPARASDSQPDKTPTGLPSLEQMGLAPQERAVTSDIPPQDGGETPGFVTWISENWVYAISALSLGLAGIFLVQYGVENGLVSPTMRVLLAIAFGFGLVFWGQRIRIKEGHGATDGEAQATAFLPAVFSGAGIVTIYAAVLAAQALYGLIGPGATLLGLVVTSAIAMVLGWVSGPVLAAIGLIGATLAPFIVGGESDNPETFYAYFCLVGLMGLGIDTLRRWAWVSVLALVLAATGGGVLAISTEIWHGYAVMLTGLTLGAIGIPQRQLLPDHPAPGFIEASLSGTSPAFPVWLAAIAMAVTVALIAILPRGGEADLLLVTILLVVLFAAIAAWGMDAPGLSEVAALPVLGLWALVILEMEFGAASVQGSEETPGTLNTVFSMTVCAAICSALAGWRALWGQALALWAIIAALAAPVTVLLIEVFWTFGEGGYPWAGVVMGLAALMCFLAERLMRSQAEHAQRGFAYATLSTLALIALALFTILTTAALTLALSVLLVAAVWLDRRFDLPEMAWFTALGVLTLGYRLVLDPGIGFGFEGPGLPVAAAYLGGVAGAGAALWLLGSKERPLSRVFLESGFMTFAGIAACVFLYRWIDAALPRQLGTDSHWSMGLTATVWALLSLAQVYRMRLPGRLRILRQILCWTYAVFAGALLLVGATFFSPLLGGGFFKNVVFGFPPLDTAAVAYLLPALPILLAAVWMQGWPRVVPMIAGIGLLTNWVFIEVRLFWHGDPNLDQGFLQPELYTYTVILLLVGAGLLYQAIARRSIVLRRVALAVIGLTVAKVFFIDASGLTGLYRVFSFLGLGLALAGLAWLDRWAAGQATEEEPPSPPAEST